MARWKQEYLERLAELYSSKKTDIEIADALNAEFNEDFTPKSVERKRYSLKWIKKHITKPTAADIPKTVTVDDIVLDEMRERDKRRKTKLMKDMSRQLADRQEFLDAIIGAVQGQVYIEPTAPRYYEGATCDATAVLLISDSHFGEAVDPARMQGIGGYDLEIAEEMGARLFESVSEITDALRRGHNIKKLIVNILGDIIAGLINKYKGWHDNTEAAAVTQIWSYAVPIIKQLFLNLLNVYEEIEVNCIAGNHGRMGRFNQMDFIDNFDYMLYRILEREFEEYDQITFNIPESWFLLHKIYNWNCLAIHGDGIRGYQGIPYYGIERALMQYHGLMEDNINYFFTGHFHTTTMLEHAKGDVLMNGSWPGPSEYAVKQLRRKSQSRQWFLIFNEKKGLIYMCPIYLRQAPDEVN